MTPHTIWTNIITCPKWAPIKTQPTDSIFEVNNWKLTHYHFGKDGRESYSGRRFNHTYEEMAEGLVRFYTKIMPNGTIIPRFEQIQTPHNTLDREIQNMMLQHAKK